MEKPEGKRSLERFGCCWKDDIKMDVKKIGWSCRLDGYGL